jgi:hypothetical protein
LIATPAIELLLLFGYAHELGDSEFIDLAGARLEHSCRITWRIGKQFSLESWQRRRRRNNSRQYY